MLYFKFKILIINKNISTTTTQQRHNKKIIVVENKRHTSSLLCDCWLHNKLINSKITAFHNKTTKNSNYES
jgi:hypothetical protein